MAITGVDLEELQGIWSELDSYLAMPGERTPEEQAAELDKIFGMVGWLITLNDPDSEHYRRP